MTMQACRSGDEFLEKMQWLIVNNDMTSSYKLALLLAVMRRALDPLQNYFVDAQTLRIPFDDLSREFLRLYWHQGRVYSETKVIVQLTNQQANLRIFGLIRKFCEAHAGRGELRFSQAAGLADFPALVRRCTAEVVKKNPVKFIHGHEFFFEVNKTRDGVCVSAQTTAYLRRFQPMLTELIESRWEAFVRGLKSNRDIFGVNSRQSLRDFLFRPEGRDALEDAYVLLDRTCRQRHCFYCGANLSKSKVHVDHFLPFSRYYPTQAFNFVLACSNCNSSKSDYLAAADHVRHWIERNELYAGAMIDACRGIMESGVIAVPQTAVALYETAARSGEGLWVQRKTEAIKPTTSSFDFSAYDIPELLRQHLQVMRSHAL